MVEASSPSETIAKAMEGVTPGEWETRQMGKRLTRELDRLFVVGHSDIVHGLDGICEPDRLNDRNFAEDNANMRYIAACNPGAMREVLDELYALRETALKLEAMEQREELLVGGLCGSTCIRLAVGAGEHSLALHFVNSETLDMFHNGLRAYIDIARARTLIQGEKP